MEIAKLIVLGMGLGLGVVGFDRALLGVAGPGAQTAGRGGAEAFGAGIPALAMLRPVASGEPERALIAPRAATGIGPEREPRMWSMGSAAYGVRRPFVETRGPSPEVAVRREPGGAPMRVATAGSLDAQRRALRLVRVRCEATKLDGRGDLLDREHDPLPDSRGL